MVSNPEVHMFEAWNRATHRMTVAASLLLAPALCAQNAAPAQQGTSAMALRPGATVAREIAGGGVDSYSVQLAKDQVLDATAVQDGIDLVVTVVGPDGHQIDYVDSPNGINGPEPVWFMAPTAGTYRLEVRPLEAGATAGKYTMTLKSTRMASAAEQQVLGRERALALSLGQQDVTSLGALLAPNATWIPAGGAHLDRQELLQARRTPDAKYVIQPTRLRLQLFGDVAVVSGHESIADSTTGTASEREFSRTWMRQNGNWMLISSQLTGATEPTRGVSLEPSTLDRYVGQYRGIPGQSSPADSVPLNIARDANRLVIRNNNGTVALEPEAPGIFYSSNLRGRLIFTAPENGQGMQIILVPYTSNGRVSILQKMP